MFSKPLKMFERRAGCKFEHRGVKTVFPNGELRGMNAHRKTACTRLNVVPRQRTLASWVKLTVGIQGKRMRRNDDAFAKALKNGWRNLRAMH